MRRGVAAVIIAAALASTATACTAPAAADGRLRIVAAFYPWQFIAERVGGDLVSVSNLTKLGAEPHDLELTPRQVASLAKADFVIYEHGVQPSVDDAVAQQARHHALDVTTVIPLRTHSGIGGRDPHIWLDPVTFASVIATTRDRLTAIAATHAAQFAANARRLTSELFALDRDIRVGLAHCASKIIVTSHTAFGYFADRYGMRQVGVAGIDAESDPSPRRIADVVALVRATGAFTVYYETLVSPAIAKSVAREAKVASAVLDPIEGATAHLDYLQLMRSNLATLITGQHCS